MDAVVVSVNQHGFFAEAGPLRIFVSTHVSINALSTRDQAKREVDKPPSS